METPASLPYSRGFHRFALLLAAATLVLIVAGALVTSNDAGLAVPDWPTSFGSLYKMPPMVAGIKYEHGHRMIAESIGLFTVILSFLMLRAAELVRAAWQAVGMTLLFMAAVISVSLAHGTERHAALLSRAQAVGAMSFFGGAALLISLALIVRAFREDWPTEAKVAIVALPTVMVQGVLGGVTVLFFLPWYVSTLHATVGQTFFSLVILMSLVTSAGWKSLASGGSVPDRRTRVLAYASIACAYIQLMLGAAFRHSGMKLVPHLLWAGVTTAVLAWTALRLVRRHSDAAPLYRSGLAVLSMLGLQLLLGFAAYLTRVVWSKDAVQPLTSMVVSTVAHVAGGAVLLSLTWIAAAQVRRAGARSKLDHVRGSGGYHSQAVTA